jgi:alpha-glucosidase
VEGRTAWWRDAVVYQVYPRSFQDSDGDGVGDLPGVTSRLQHIRELGADAVWLSPFYPSPGADLGYDISDFTGVHPQMGTLDDLDALVAKAHDLGLKVLLDLVPSHTSIEHPWFREHPDWYVWSDDGPPNNWLASFGGPAWSLDEATGRWYLHSFYPEQPDLDWANPEVREAMAEVVRFWSARGADGFRVDALHALTKDALLRDDPPAAGQPPLPLPDAIAHLDRVHSSGVGKAAGVLSAIRDAAPGAFLVGEVYLPTAGLAPYLENLDSAFVFEFLHSPLDAKRLATVIAEAARIDTPAWVLSNHDFPRLAGRFGPERVRLAAMLLLTLPGPTFVYQGDEIGMEDGPAAVPPVDRYGRDPFRSPMQWDGSPAGGFTTGDPWVPIADPQRRNVADQARDDASILSLYRDLIALRPSLSGELTAVEARDGVLSYRRGEHLVELNLGDGDAAVGGSGSTVLSTRPEPSAERLSPGEGRITGRMV